MEILLHMLKIQSIMNTYYIKPVKNFKKGSRLKFQNFSQSNKILIFRKFVIFFFKDSIKSENQTTIAEFFNVFIRILNSLKIEIFGPVASISI